MKIILNGNPHETHAATLAAILAELDFADAVIATAVNGTFVSAPERAETPLRDGDQVEILAPMQGG
ncbi:thiamine biosynthesis protein ThiS [Phyllobacterium phragmitis]|uniref:Thiamine biosynthesis protein ThiS n=1 Tax=Phyllobacterium phragmitis TaxID=2670329 RepID=A0A2S9IRV7_9HYPH|nr:sulfur carrier protein ThiS [Phyllobacterium phragmitis]PRD43249.1 thiamine biosynthesis protein ThiS [Phyllobacterium phragmitis]